nr:hypothetical protein [Tanacetum cinerariifolium]
MTKPYSSHRFIANCFNARNLKIEVKRRSVKVKELQERCNIKASQVESRKLNMAYVDRRIRRIGNYMYAFSCEVQALIGRIFFAGYGICNKCLFNACHDLCVVDYLNNVNVLAKSKSKSNRKKVWKPTGKVFTNIGHRWIPTATKCLSRATPAAAFAPIPVDTTGTPSSTSVDQDAPFASTSLTPNDSQEPVLHQDVEGQDPPNA